MASSKAKSVQELEARIVELEREMEETDWLNDRLAYLLTHTARALKGTKAGFIRYSWSDLPAVASKMRMENEEYRRRDMARIGLRPKAKPRHKQQKEQPYLLKQLEIQWVEFMIIPQQEFRHGHDDKGRAPERPAPPEGPAEPGTD